MTRIRSLAAAVVLGLLASLLLVGPAAQAAISRSITIHAAPKAAIHGTKVTFAGKLTNSPPGSMVKVQRKAGAGWVAAKTAHTSNGAGNWSVKIALPATPGNYRYRAYAPATGPLKAATSSVIVVTSLRRTTFYVVPMCPCPIIYPAPGQVVAGSDMAVGGRLNKPFTVGARISLQRKNGSVWQTRGTSTVTSTGAFIVHDTNPQTGVYRVIVDRQGLNSAATTPPRMVTMS